MSANTPSLPPSPPPASSLLPSDWAVPAIFRRRLGNRPGRQRAMAAEGHVLLVLNAVPDEGGFRRKAGIFWRDPQGKWRSTLSVEGLRSLQRLVEGYSQVAQQLEERLEKSEETATILHEIVSRCVPVGRATRNLHLALQEARQAVDDPELINLRDLAGEADRTIELVREDAKIGLEFLLARKSEEQAAQSERIAKAGHRLNLLAAIFLPVTALGGLFGMNLHHGFEEASPALFWMVTLSAGVAGGVLLAWTRRD